MFDDFAIRDATAGDATALAEFYDVASDGLSAYIWSRNSDTYPGLTPLEIGARHYAADEGDESYRNCLVVERDGEVGGMMHAYLAGAIPPEMKGDPVLKPYTEFSAPGSFYISGLALAPDIRGLGIGTGLLAIAEDKAIEENAYAVSLLVFEQNEGAVRLYLREGFEEIDRREIVPHPLIRRTGDVLLMLKSI